VKALYSAGEYRQAAGAATQRLKRRFPPPWSAEVQPNYYVVRDHNEQLDYNFDISKNNVVPIREVRQ
jgi:hypothetical protein